MTTPSKQRFTVAEMAGADPYKLTTGLIVPRPIGWIGTISTDGVPNLAPYSFFNAVSGNPPTFLFAPALSARRDTLDNLHAVGEFTINIVTVEVAEAMNATAASLPAGEDEFVAAGVTAAPSVTIRPPLVAECRANIECIVTEIITVGNGNAGNAVVIGEAVEFHIDPAILDGTRVDQAELKAVGRHAGNWYSHATGLFELARPE